MMNGLTSKRVACAAAIALALATTMTVVDAQNIYKCTVGGQISYTDTPCPGKHGELLHQASDTEIIDQYLRLGQEPRAQRYAHAHGLDALYTQRLAVYQQRRKERAKRAEAEAEAAQERAERVQQQALADQAANSAQLRAQNQLLREQNNQYQSELSRPVYNSSPLYWNPAPPYWNRPHHGDHDNRPSREPIFHPCTQLAGGRVKC